MNDLNYKTTTEGQTQITRMTWTVPDFINLINDGYTKELRTKESKDLTNDETDSRFKLKMQFKGRYNEVIEIYFLSPQPVFLEYVLRRLSEYEDEEFVMKIKSYHIVDAQKWQYLDTLLKENCDDFIIGNRLILQFEIKMTCNIKVDFNVPEIQPYNDCEDLLKCGIFSDITIKSAEAIEYKVHKAVLANKSMVLKAHFEHKTTESTTNVVESPLESEVLQEVLTYIYSDKAPRVNEIPEKLLAAADYYQLNRLKSLCEEVLHKKLTVENAVETFELADLHSATALKQLTLEFIKDGQAKLITKTEGWAKVKSVELIKRIYEYIMDDVDEDGLFSQKKYKVKNWNSEM